MKNWLFAVAVLCAATTVSARDVRMSVSIGDPHFYGRISVGHYPPPPLIYPEPIVVVQPRVYVEPMYLRVPPSHARKWRRHCRHYGACNRPVYFVQDDWYQDVYVPRYKRDHDDDDDDDDDD